MIVDPSFPAGGFPNRTRFVLVNNRVPRSIQHCALCGGFIEEGYVRDSQTRLVYCDTRCFAGGHIERPPSSHDTKGKCHEVLESRL